VEPVAEASVPRPALVLAEAVLEEQAQVIVVRG